MSGDSAIGVEAVLRAIDALYLNPDPYFKEQASNWLCEFQTSLPAWNISDQLLYMKRDLNSCYFGAQTIRIKMTTSSLRLGMNRRHALISQFEECKAKVIETLSLRMKTAQMPMLTRIFNCLASWWDNTGIMTERDVPISPLLETAFYVLRNPASADEATYDAVNQWICALLYQCRSYPNSSNNLLIWLQKSIYELVSVMQTCVSTVTSIAGPAGSSQQHTDLELYRDRCTCLAHIFASLARTLRSALVDQPSASGSGSLGDLRTLDCVLAVLELPAPLGNRDLVAVTFHCLHSLADDAIRHRSQIQPSPVSGQENEANASLRRASALVPYFTRVVAALTRYCPSDTADLESTDELRDFREDVHDLMQDILSLVGAETIFVELYTHVQKLQMLAVSNNANVTPSEVLRESEACIFMLATVAKRLSPHDPEGHIAALIAGLVLPGLDGPCPFPLQEVGCVLYMELSHWAACHPQLRRQIVNQLIGIVEKAAGLEVNQLQPGQKIAVGAALSALGDLCSIYRASNSTQQNGFTAASPTADSEQNRTGLLDEHWPDLVQRVAFNLPRLAWVPIYDATHFFTGIGRGLLASVGSGGGGVDFDPQLARQVLPSRLAQICSVSLECLTKLMNDNISISGSDTLTDPRVWLDYLAAIFRAFGSFLRRLNDGNRQHWTAGNAGGGASTTQTAPGGALTPSAQTCLSESLCLVSDCLWPVIAQVLTHYASRERPIEHVCRLIRFIVRCYSVHLKDLLPSIAEKIVVSYTTGAQHSSFLYLSSVLVDEFGEQTDCRAGLVRVYEALGGPTLSLLSGPGLMQQPHTVEDLYRLCTRLVQHCPVVFLTSQQVDLHELCNTAVRSLSLWYTGSSANGSPADDPSMEPTNATEPTPQSSSSNSNVAGSSASAAAARFLVDLFLFTAEASEVTATQVYQATQGTGTGPLANPSCQSAAAAQRVLVWLTQPLPQTGSDAAESGGQKLISAVLQACCLGSSEERLPDLADILYHLKWMTQSELFTVWLTTAVNTLPLLRADGLVHATPQQIEDFRNVLMNSSRTSAVSQALASFSRLFR